MQDYNTIIGTIQMRLNGCQTRSVRVFDNLGLKNPLFYLKTILLLFVDLCLILTFQILLLLHDPNNAILLFSLFITQLSTYISLISVLPLLNL